MPDKYGAHERAALLALMLQNRAVPNPELTKMGIELRPAGRAKLNKAGLLKTWTESRPYVHEITAEGIAWIEQDLEAAEPPVRSGPYVVVSFQVLRALAQHIRRGGGHIADILHPADLETLIRTAYVDLSVKPQDWVRLAKLRPKLNGAGKDEVDHVLLRMVKEGVAHLAPDSNRKVLTDADHAAAIRVGSEDKHLMAIEES